MIHIASTGSKGFENFIGDFEYEDGLPVGTVGNTC